MAAQRSAQAGVVSSVLGIMATPSLSSGSVCTYKAARCSNVEPSKVTPVPGSFVATFRALCNKLDLHVFQVFQGLFAKLKFKPVEEVDKSKGHLGKKYG